MDLCFCPFRACLIAAPSPGCCPGLWAFALTGRGVEHGDAETRRYGDTEVRRHGGAETRRCGDTEVWRYGGKYYVFEDTESFLELRDSVTLCLF